MENCSSSLLENTESHIPEYTRSGCLALNITIGHYLIRIHFQMIRVICCSENHLQEVLPVAHIGLLSSIFQILI